MGWIQKLKKYKFYAYNKLTCYKLKHVITNTALTLNNPSRAQSAPFRILSHDGFTEMAMPAGFSCPAEVSDGLLYE